MIAKYLAVAAFVAGVVLGFAPMYGWHAYWENDRARVEAEAAVEQEKKNVAVVTHFQDALSGVIDHYQRNPVRVRIQGGKTSPGCPAPRAEDILLTVGGYQGGVSANPVQ